MSINPSSASVAVEAVRNGTTGNVPANAITVVPQAEDPSITQVRKDPTSGGSRTEFPQVEQEDVDKAIETLQEQLAASFQDELRDPSIALRTPRSSRARRSLARPPRASTRASSSARSSICSSLG